MMHDDALAKLEEKLEKLKLKKAKMLLAVLKTTGADKLDAKTLEAGLHKFMLQTSEKREALRAEYEKEKAKTKKANPETPRDETHAVAFPKLAGGEA